jgi:membrane-associated phospholipid phosphatase
MDKDIVIFLNGFIGEHSLLDEIAVRVLSDASIFNGLFLVAILTGLWFSNARPDVRGRLIVGVGAALVATALSRAIQISIPIHPRPFVSLTLNALGPQPGVRLSSFPSDHATLVFGLCAVILLNNKWLGLVSFAWMTFICAFRVANGAHWPSDILGGFVLGAGAVILSEWIQCPKWIWSFKEVHRGPFYGLMMIGAYETATFFGDIFKVLGHFQ